MKDFFKKWFPGEKKQESIIPKSEEKNDTPPENLPLGVEDLHLRRSEIEKLQQERQTALEKHRTAVKELESYDVAKKTKEGKRSKTYNEYLGSIEAEIEDIAKKLKQTRDDFDMPQSREEVLRERMKRLETLAKMTKEKFAETELGQNYFSYKKDLADISSQITKLSLEGRYDPDADRTRKELNNQRIEIEKDLQQKIYSQKEYMNYARTSEKINQLLGNTSINLHDALDDQYDENGQMRVR